jgi:hypothetical protein
MSRFYLGLEYTHVTDIEQALEIAVDAKFDFIAAPLVHPRFRRDAQGISKGRSGPGTSK